MLIYYFNDFDAVDELMITQMLQQAAPQQVELVRSMKTLSRQREQAVSYAMLAYALQHDSEKIRSSDTVVAPFPADWLLQKTSLPPTWAVGEHGKPYLTNREGIHFNISHCREAIVTAVSGQEIGVDVEGRRRFSDTLLQRSFNEEEQACVLRSDDPELEFARIWTRKEAWFKYTGTGILIDHLKSVESDAAESHCPIKTTLVTPPPPFQERVFYLSVAEGESLKQ